MAKAEPNVVPLCDVLLVLLIIFMVITPLVQKGIDVRAPRNLQADTSARPAQRYDRRDPEKRPDDRYQSETFSTISNPPATSCAAIYSTRTDKTIFLRADVKSPSAKSST